MNDLAATFLGEDFSGLRRLTQLRDASAFHNRRVLLPLRKGNRPFTVRVGASELLAVAVIHSDLPVMVLSALVSESRSFQTSFHIIRFSS
jgi:hypothetical protein